MRGCVQEELRQGVEAELPGPRARGEPHGLIAAAMVPHADGHPERDAGC
jgi:hypothetical protein